MLLQNIMFWWACLALLIAILAMGGLLTRKVVDKDTGQTSKSFLDFSAEQLEGREMQKVLSDALSEAGTDAEFEQHYKVAIEAVTGLEAETSWAWLGRFLMEYLRRTSLRLPRASWRRVFLRTYRVVIISKTYHQQLRHNTVLNCKCVV